MTRASFAISLATLLLSMQVYAFTPAYKWPSDDIGPATMKDARVMSELCIRSKVNNGQYFPTSHDDRYINNNLSEEEAKDIAEAFCEGALAGLIRGLEYADPPYGPLSQLSECYEDAKSAKLAGELTAEQLRVVFGRGYRTDDTEETTTQVLLRGLWQMYHCQGEPPGVAAKE